MYIIVFCGYEGLDAVLWAGDDKVEAVAKVKEARCKISKLSKLKEKYGMPEEGFEEDEDAWMAECDRRSDRYYKILSKWPELWRHLGIMGDEHDTDRVCVMQGEEWGFECVCKELEVSPSESWYY